MRTKNHPSTPRTKKDAPRALKLARVPAEQLRRLVKPHTGYEAFVALFEKLVAQYGDELGAGIDLDAMLTAVSNAQRLQPAVADAREQLALVSNTELVESAKGWKEMMLIYGRARQAARTNAQIEVMIEPFMKFMKTGPRTKKTTTPTAG